MAGQATGAIDVVAQQHIAGAKIQVLNYRFFEAADGHLRGDGKFRLDLCLNARHRGARACFRDRWNPQRFEPVGDLFVVPPDAELIARSDEDRNQTSVVCELDAAPVMELFTEVPEPSDSLLIASLDVRSQKIKNLLQWVAEEVRHPGFASETMLEMMISHLRIELIRHGDHVLDETSRTQGGLASWQLRVIEERLREACAAPALAELAALCRLSVRQLSRGFRASKDCSLGAYVAQRQLEHAKRLLAGEQTIAMIANQLGFATSSAFCCAFRRDAAVTPGEYRTRLLRDRQPLP